MISDEARAERLASVDFDSPRVIPSGLIDGQVVDEQLLASLSDFTDPERANRLLVIGEKSELSIGGIALQITPKGKPPLNMLLAQGEAGFKIKDLAAQDTYRPGLGYETKRQRASTDLTEVTNRLKRVARLLHDKTDRGLIIKRKENGTEVTNWLDVDLVVDERGEEKICIVRTVPKIEQKPKAVDAGLDNPQKLARPEPETVLNIDVSDVLRVSTRDPYNTMLEWIRSEKGGMPDFEKKVDLVDTKRAMRFISPEELKLKGVARRFMQANRIIHEATLHS